MSDVSFTFLAELSESKMVQAYALKGNGRQTILFQPPYAMRDQLECNFDLIAQPNDDEEEGNHSIPSKHLNKWPFAKNKRNLSVRTNNVEFGGGSGLHFTNCVRTQYFTHVLNKDMDSVKDHFLNLPKGRGDIEGTYLAVDKFLAELGNLQDLHARGERIFVRLGMFSIPVMLEFQAQFKKLGLVYAFTGYTAPL